MGRTAKISQFMFGDKLYQKRAREALPILVRQAHAKEKIFYSDLANELGMSNPRNLNYVLGSIGQTLNCLSERAVQEERLPPIQCLVVNKATGLPGEGISWFISSRKNWDELPRRDQKILLDRELTAVYLYAKWLDVLEELNLSPLSPDYEKLIEEAAKPRGGGESERHRKLKEHVASNPEILNLPTSIIGNVEHRLPSGDRLDVMFRYRCDWIAAEVKSSVSSESDILRELFQCVKYEKVIEAVQATFGLPQSARAVLILEENIPKTLIPIKNILGVEVIEGVVVG